MDIANAEAARECRDKARSVLKDDAKRAEKLFERAMRLCPTLEGLNSELAAAREAAAAQGSGGASPPPTAEAQASHASETAVPVAGTGGASPEATAEIERLMSLGEANLYGMLGVPAGTHGAELKRAYFKLSRLVHPDKCPHPRSTEAFQLVQVAVSKVCVREEVGGATTIDCIHQ